MSLNIQQIFTNNPASSMVATDLLYLGRSPYNTTDDFAITFANFVASIGTATPTGSTIVKYDANKNISANNFLPGFQTIATAAATTTLTVASPFITQFTGSTTQICQMPDVSTLVLGQPFLIINASTGAVTVNSSGGNAIQVMAAGTSMELICDAITGSTASSWQIVNYGTSASVYPLALALGGTNNALTANAGGILWSDSTKLNLLAGTSTSNQLLLSGNAATPVWSTSTYPTTNAANTLLYASSANTMAALATANSSILITDAGGVPSLGTALPTGITATTPSSSNQVANKSYVDSVAAGLNPADAAYAASTANLTGYTYLNGASGIGATLTAGSNGAFTIDGQSPPINSIILYKNDTTGSGAYNGLYNLTTVGGVGTPAILTRALNYDQPSDINSTGLIPVINGTVNAGTGWLLTNTIAAVGAGNPLTYVQFGQTAGVIPVTSGGTGLSSTTANQLLYSSSNNVIAGLATANSSVLITSAGGVPSWSTTLPSGLSATNLTLITPTLGAALATSINFGGSTLNTYTQQSSWTPAITFGTPGDLSVSYATQTGKYTRIGNLIHVSYTLVFTPTYTTASGNFSITGLPFVSNSGGDINTNSVYTQTITFPASTTSLLCELPVNSSSLLLVGIGSTATTVVSTTNVVSGTQKIIQGSMTYLI